MLISKERYETLTKESQPCHVNEKIVQPVDTTTVDVQPASSIFELPKKWSKRAAELYSAMLRQEIFNHNERGELIINGRTIEGSNIGKIIQYIVSPPKTRQNVPIGSHEAQKALKTLNVLPSKTRQHGGMFVKKRKGRHINVPGVEKRKKIDWIKY